MHDAAERATLEFSLKRSGNGQVMELLGWTQIIEEGEDRNVYRTPVEVVAGTGRRSNGYIEVVTDEDGVYSVKFNSL